MNLKGMCQDIDDSAKIADTAIICGFTYIGKNVVIEDNVLIANYVEINSGCVIGQGTKIQYGTVLNSDTIVGRNSFLAGGIITTDEKYPTRHTESITRKPCKIGDKVVIGAGAILNSVDIGDGSIIGAGANVLKDVNPYEIWYGNPAKCQGTRDDFDKKQLKELQ